MRTADFWSGGVSPTETPPNLMDRDPLDRDRLEGIRGPGT